MGKFYYSMCAYTPAFIGSLLAIMIERPSRRPALAIYVANIASETIFRIFIARGYIKAVKNGEVFLFTLTMSVLLYIIKKNGFGTDPVSLALKFIIGRQEAKSHHSLNQQIARIQTIDTINTDTNSTPNPISTNFVKDLLEKFNSMFPKHESCPHRQRSCLTYISSSFIRSLFLGWFGKSVLQTISKPKLIFLHPNRIRNNFLNSDNIYFGLFLASFTAIYKGVNCSLRWASNGSHDWHSFIAALFAGPTMFLSPNTSITLYLMWKCIESLYCIGVKKGYIRFVMPTVHLVYALSTAQLFYSAVLEPKHMKPSYMKFLDRMTAHRLHLLNRMVLDVFGTDSSAGVNCSLRWASNGSHDWHSFIAALFAGPTMFLSPNTSITLYLMWKCIESLYCIGVKKGYIRFVMPTVHLVYALSTAQLFYSAVLEPKHMKPSYMKFLDRMTAHRLHLLNRMVLDVFGTDSSAGYESFSPNFDLQFTTKRFQESVLLWLL
ncbi:unnamed protein product [Medioppia subpectinata]|uniref:Transmembrane protein 135 N-terminal domain-containing protein n=1 Tax=Medioppia subpectinata TaxID=1979941 RepID=A0A7R9KS87_9ACAR|nr:unnamed protein product [Medioppia subpectinata]CAG2107655.1 unnamed protein product [Medioppia subpectinata]